MLEGPLCIACRKPFSPEDPPISHEYPGGVVQAHRLCPPDQRVRTVATSNVESKAASGWIFTGDVKPLLGTPLDRAYMIPPVTYD